MDRLAARDVRFENAFVTTSICAASRASILTSLHEGTHGYTFGTPPLARRFADASYPRLLRAAGYRTGFIGKLGVRVEKGATRAMFDVSRPKSRNPYLKDTGGGEKRHLTDIIGDEAVEFLRANDPRPFCLSVSFHAPHAEDGDPAQYVWPRDFDELYRDVYVEPWGPYTGTTEPEMLGGDG